MHRDCDAVLARAMNQRGADCVSLGVERRAARALLSSALGALLAVGCGGAVPARVTETVHHDEPVVVVAAEPAPATPPAWVDPYVVAREDAVRIATPVGRRVLEAADVMLEENVVVQGSCWGWAAAVYERAGGASRQAFRGRKSGPWAETATIQPGDWLYFMPGEGGGTHSAIFVGWIEGSPGVGLTISYVGGNREETGRYSTYDLSRVYRIVRLIE